MDDLEAVTTYTFESCMNACDNYNVKNDGACKAVTYNTDLTTSVSFSGGNCIFKNDRANQNVIGGNNSIASAFALQ